MRNPNLGLLIFAATEHCPHRPKQAISIVPVQLIIEFVHILIVRIAVHIASPKRFQVRRQLRIIILDYVSELHTKRFRRIIRNRSRRRTWRRLSSRRRFVRRCRPKGAPMVDCCHSHNSAHNYNSSNYPNDDRVHLFLRLDDCGSPITSGIRRILGLRCNGRLLSCLGLLRLGWLLTLELHSAIRAKACAIGKLFST